MRGGVNEFEMIFPHAGKLSRARPKRSSNELGLDDGLLNLLRDVRAQMADQADVPAYVVASNKTLEQMAELLPANRRELLKVHGMGPKRAARFGGPFLAAIQVYGEGRSQ